MRTQFCIHDLVVDGTGTVWLVIGHLGGTRWHIREAYRSRPISTIWFGDDVGDPLCLIGHHDGAAT